VDDQGGNTGAPDDPLAGTLPRRARQRHLEPQLRVPGGRGDDTPFAAFAGPDGPADGPTDDRDDPATIGAEITGARAAAFQRGTGRGDQGTRAEG